MCSVILILFEFSGLSWIPAPCPRFYEDMLSQGHAEQEFRLLGEGGTNKTEISNPIQCIY